MLMLKWIKRLFRKNEEEEMEAQPRELTEEEKIVKAARLKVLDDSMRALMISQLLRGVDKSFYEGELTRIGETIGCGELLENTIEVGGQMMLDPIFAQTLRFLPDSALQVQFGKVIKVGTEPTEPSV